ncbi:chemotaxis protein MotB [Caldalkalibacillus uzonensis]|uniref:Chemotaxis protein MotB n=1 Tax=Caldalkalibacillus uzonensis TaxID=353224 RepID=A0ABU0CTN9_9BACI|nr:OmpA family protein [Caldalkalibacillus uzonensis]MDQ0339789.1 chemotaxis protein MotB [Caldalkalibacillus uzonensis]
MRKRKSYFEEEQEPASFWPSFTDMMSTIVLVMLFVALVAFVQSIFDAYAQREIKREMAQVAAVKKHIADLIQEELEERVGEDKIIRGPNNTISIEGDILFETGEAEISEQGKAILRPLSIAFQRIIELEEVSQYLYIILIEGHTDTVPYDNWTLSTQRAVAVVQYLFEVNPVLARDEYAQYFAATGYSEFKPIAEGNDPKSLQQNRRISFQIIVDDEKWQQKMYQLLEGELQAVD